MMFCTVQHGTSDTDTCDDNGNKIQIRTRLLSNARPTTRECVHLVTRGHFRSRDKDGGHTIRSAIVGA